MVFALDRVLKHFTESRADGTHLRLDARRQLLSCHLQALKHQLAGKVGVDVVFEDDDDLRETGLGQRAHHLHVWQPAHDPFDGEGDLLLDVEWPESLDLGEDHHLLAGHVREGIDG